MSGQTNHDLVWNLRKR